MRLNVFHSHGVSSTVVVDHCCAIVVVDYSIVVMAVDGALVDYCCSMLGYFVVSPAYSIAVVGGSAVRIVATEAYCCKFVPGDSRFVLGVAVGSLEQVAYLGNCGRSGALGKCGTVAHVVSDWLWFDFFDWLLTE